VKEGGRRIARTDELLKAAVEKYHADSRRCKRQPRRRTARWEPHDGIWAPRFATRQGKPD
jgi:hypothetical protein